MKLELILRLLGRSEEPQELEQLKLELVHKLDSLPNLGGRRTSPEAFLEKLILKISADSTSECWNWVGTNNNGYGKIEWGVSFRAHRLIKELIHSPPPKSDSYACHKCDNPLCVNPDHIYWGDAMSNSIDRANSRLERYLYGSEHSSSKLNEEQVLRVLHESKTRKYGWVGLIANDLGVSRSTIRGIIYGWTWKQVTGLQNPKCKVRTYFKDTNRTQQIGQLHDSWAEAERSK